MWTKARFLLCKAANPGWEWKGSSQCHNCYCHSCQHWENEYSGNYQMHQDIWIKEIGLHQRGFSSFIYWYWLDEKVHLFLSKFLRFQSYHSEKQSEVIPKSIVWIYTLFFTTPYQCQYSTWFGGWTQTTLGVTLDNNTEPEAPIGALILESSFLHLRRLAKFSSFISLYHFILTHALMTSQLDFCNAHEVGPSQTLSLPISDYTSFSPYPKQEHISPLLASLHWLYFGLWIDLKMILFVFECQSSWRVCSILTPPLGAQSSRSVFLTFGCKFLSIIKESGVLSITGHTHAR